MGVASGVEVVSRSKYTAPVRREVGRLLCGEAPGCGLKCGCGHRFGKGIGIRPTMECRWRLMTASRLSTKISDGAKVWRSKWTADARKARMARTALANAIG